MATTLLEVNQRTPFAAFRRDPLGTPELRWCKMFDAVLETSGLKSRFSKGKHWNSRMDQALDRVTARALVEAGYMPLAEYLDIFGEEIATETYHVSPSSTPAHAEREHHHPWIPQKIMDLLHLH